LTRPKKLAKKLATHLATQLDLEGENLKERTINDRKTRNRCRIAILLRAADDVEYGLLLAEEAQKL